MKDHLNPRFREVRILTFNALSSARIAVKVAAYQASLPASRSMPEAIASIRAQIRSCESIGVDILCCPEAFLGGLADYAEDPTRFAIGAGQLDSAIASLASDTVTTIVGFTELGKEGLLYNSAAVFHRGTVTGIYRKLHPAINRSVYEAGHDVTVFQIGNWKFGILICNDSNYAELAKLMSAQGATALFVPTNNGMPPKKGGPELVAEARTVDIATAVENSMWVIRADVAGRAGELVAHGSSEIVNPDGIVVQSAKELREDLIVAEIENVRLVA